MRTKLGKSITCMSMVLITLTTTNSVSSDMMTGFEDCRRASTDELNAMRGGFLINADGLQFLLSLGIERITYVNGALVAMSTFNLLPQLNSSQLRQSLISQVGASNMQQIPSTLLPATAAIGPTANPAPVQTSVAPVPASASPASSSALPSVASVASASPAPSTASAAPMAAQNAPTTLSTAATDTGNYQPIQVVQIGPRNTFTPPSAPNLRSGTMAVIQNTLDNQLIRNMTIINATLATRELLRSTALSSALSRIPANFGR